MEYICVDLETTGLPRYDLPAEHPDQPWIASAAVIHCSADFDVIAEQYWLIKPDGWVLGEEAARVNGLTMELLHEKGKPIAEFLDTYEVHIREGRVLTAHNCRFEHKLIRGSLRRAGRDDLFELTKTVCTMESAVGVCKLPKKSGGGYKNPKLLEAYEHFYKQPFRGQHDALGDARACVAVARFLKKIGCLKEPAIYRAKEGTAAGEALKARGGTPEPRLDVDQGAPTPRGRAPF
ncbi:MAG: 3'-5' exonuclease [Pseudomonadota bacterium]|nr:3'-5' exonuclease [Pseudomonadota bacterium]